MGHLNSFLAPRGGNLNNLILKGSIPGGGGGGVPGGGGGVLKFQIDWRIIFMYMIIEISLNFGKAKY